jgi:Carboxypeptidase regulatory-like domain
MMRTRPAPFGVLACSAALFICPLLFGQATGSISGAVTDATGAAVAGAKVTVTAQATNVSRSATTDEAGHYLVPLLPVADFTVKVELQGFQTAEDKNVRLQIDEHRELDFKLAPASINETVEVNSTAVAVETQNPTLGQVITSQQVTELPLNGRDFVQLATLTPGVTQETNTQSFFNGGPSSEVSTRGSFSLSVGGSRANSTDWLFDGVDNNELTAGGIAILPSLDAIQEFKVLTFNYSAEYGTRGGPTVLVTTKSGGNQFHGSAFEFFRNTDLDARSFFATYTEQFNLNQFGGSIGGPIRKDKTFFFADIQNKMQRHGIPFTGLVPTQAMRNGDFSADQYGNPRSGFIINPNVTGSPSGTAFQCYPNGAPIPAAPDGSQAAGVNCNKIPQNLIDPIGQQLMNLYPLPNANNQTLGYNYVSQPVRRLNEGEFDIRLDHNFSAKDSMFARFSYDQATSFVPGGSPGFSEAAPFASTQSILNHGRNVALAETHVFSPTTVNQVTGGYNRIFNYITSFGSYTCEAAKIGIPGANLGGESCGLTSSQVSGGYWSVGDRGFSPFQGGTNVYSVSDTLDLIRGRHDIKVGGSFRDNQMNVLAEGFADGYWIYSGAWTGEPMADLALGIPSLAIHDQTFNGNVTGRRWKLFRPFVEDNWRVTKDLTLNLGLAWALVTPITEAHNRQANFNPANGQFIVAEPNGTNSRAGIQMDWTAWEPRIGVAWKPFGSTKTAIRGGYAIFHDSSWNQGAQGLWQNPPYYAESDYFAFSGGCTSATAACATKYGQNPTFGFTTTSNGFPIFTSPPVPNDFTGTIQSQNLNFKQGRIQQYNVNVEQEIPGQIVITAGYAGSRSSHILVDGNNLNVASPAACGTVPGYTLGCGPGGASFGLPYPAFPYSTISNISDTGRAEYNSLQIKAETKTPKYGLYALVGFTYARAYDNGFTDGLGSLLGATYFPLPNWQKLDWALSQINLNSNFTASVVYSLPFGKGQKFGSSWNGPVNAVLGNWEINLIEKITSGFPVFVVDSANFTSGVNFQNNGNSLIRPDQTCSPQSSNPTLGRWFNTSCFAFPAAGELGNASRTPVSGPGFANTDFSAVKNFPLGLREGAQLQFRAEFFNLFNHPQFATPGGDINSPATFGIISSTVNNPRVIQFALKLLF